MWYARQKRSKSAPCRRVNQTLQLEVLESRYLLAAEVKLVFSTELPGPFLKVQGTDNADVLDVRYLNGNLNLIQAQVRDANGGVLAAGLFASANVHGVQMLAEAGNDTIINLTNQKNSIYAGAGNDFVFALGAEAIVWGEEGNDRIYAYATLDGNLLAGHEGNDTIHGGSGSSHISGGSGDDSLNGGSGNDTLIGHSGNDALFGNGGDDSMFGSQGDDDMYGGDGNDWMEGGDGDDQMWGEAHNDTLYGGNDNDLLEGGWGDDDLFGDAGADEMWGQGGHDYMVGGSNSGLAINGHIDEADEMHGGSGVDQMFGGRGDDVMHGGSSGDNLFGQHGNDQMFGDAGADLLSGGSGNDLLDGGADKVKDQIFSGTGDDEIVQHMRRHFYAPGFWVWLPEDQIYDQNVALDLVTFVYHPW